MYAAPNLAALADDVEDDARDGDVVVVAFIVAPSARVVGDGVVALDAQAPAPSAFSASSAHALPPAPIASGL